MAYGGYYEEILEDEYIGDMIESSWHRSLDSISCGADVDATYRARGEMTHYFTYTNIIEGLLLADTHSTNHTFFRFLCAKNIFRKYEGGIDWDGMATVAYDDDAIEAYGNDYQFDYEDEVKILAVRNPPKKKQ